MGKLADQQSNQQSESARVQAARARLERLRIEQGVPEFDLKSLLAHTVAADEPDEEFIEFLREMRNEGTPRELD